MAARPIMIMGCTSDAGKSFLVAALCRHLKNENPELRVAPFKAQNMSNNAAVTPDGLEIGRAQYLQALAARVAPEARMNPILLKPSADTQSQVVVMGRYDSVATKTPWLERKALLWEVVQSALRSLLTDFDQVVIEGAGSPAEVNLRDSDMVNMAVALECDADVYLVADIDRGGAFAHLLGTFECLEPRERATLRGFVLNKFRGDPALLGNAMDWLEARTGVPTVAVIPYLRHALPEEDALHHRARFDPEKLNLALVVYPYASNLDEFDALIHEPGVNVVPVRGREPLDDYAAVLLPGSKNTAESLRYLRATGLDGEIQTAARRGTPVFGVCGGLQLLGRRIADPFGIESGDIDGLGLLDVTTTLAAEKTTLQRETETHDGLLVRGYEIHHGQTRAGSGVAAHLADGLGWSQGAVTGIALHGIFDNAAYRRRWLTELGWTERDGASRNWPEVVDEELDRVAGRVAECWRIQPRTNSR